MVHYAIKNTFLKAALPVALLAGALIRPSFISLPYLFLSFIAAILPLIRADRPTPKSVAVYAIISFLYSLALAIAIGIYQGIEKANRPDEAKYPCDDFLFLRSVGFIRFHKSAGFYTVLPFLPEVILVPVTLVCAVVIVLLNHRDEQLDIIGESDVAPLTPSSPANRTTGGRNARLAAAAITSAFKRISNVGIIILASIVGSLQPSVLNFAYFGVFLFVATLWAAYTPIRHQLFNKIKMFWILFSMFHFAAIYSYQIPVVNQEWLSKTGVIKRLLGLSQMMDASCPEYWNYHFVQIDNDPKLIDQWPKYANPIAILVFFYLSVWQYTLTKDGSKMPDVTSEIDDGSSSVHEERMFGGTNDTMETTIDEGESGTEELVATTSRGRGDTMLLADTNDHTDEAPPEMNHIPMRKVTSQVVDRGKITQIFHGPGEEATAASKGIIAIISFVIYHSYTFALVTMMVWALLYHSIFGLILLFLCCGMWIVADTRSVSFLLSPLVLMYIEFLLLLQYVFSMDIQPELGTPTWLSWMGLAYVTNPVEAFAVLAVKSLLALPVFLLYRLARREKHYESLTDFERVRRLNGTYGTFSSHPTALTAAAHEKKHGKTSQLATIIHYFTSRIAIYFIFIVLLLLVWVATDIKPTFYTIGFFVLWGINIIFLKVSFGFYRRLAYVFWLALTFYTSFVIICLYAYQFKGFSDWFKKHTGFDKPWLDAIGLVDYSAVGKSGLLFVRLLSPICLFVVTMLQLKFFHDPWSRIVSSSRRGEDVEDLQRTPAGQEQQTDSPGEI